MLTFSDVVADVAGPATLSIAYVSGSARRAELRVNEGPSTLISFPATANWGTPGTLEVAVSLVAGANALTFGNSGGWAPDFDRLDVSTTGTGSPTPTDSASVTASPSAPVTASPTVSPSTAPTGNAALEAEVVALINAERARVGCAPLAVDAR